MSEKDDKAVLREIVRRADAQWSSTTSVPLGGKVVCLSGAEISVLRRMAA